MNAKTTAKRRNPLWGGARRKTPKLVEDVARMRLSNAAEHLQAAMREIDPVAKLVWDGPLGDAWGLIWNASLKLCEYRSATASKKEGDAE